MATIERVDVFPVRLPITRLFTFASGSTGPAGSGAPHVFVRVTDSDGCYGWGEARPVPQWSYETLETVTTTLRHHLVPTILGLPVTDRWELHRRMYGAIGRGPSTGQPIAKGALDTAVHDLCARATNLPLRAYLGGSTEPRPVALSYTISAHDHESAVAEVNAAREQGYRHFNFKAAVAPETDVAVGRALRETAGLEAFIWADANQGFRLHQARLTAEAFRQAGVNVLEQPLPADQLGLMQQLRASTALPLAIDEASVGPSDFLRYVSAGLVDYLVIKLTRSGGVWPALQQMAIADAAGLPLLVSGLTESLLAKCAACQVASVYGFAGPAALNGSQFIDDATIFPRKASIEFGGEVHLDSTPGIGVEPDVEALTSLRINGL